MPLDPILIADTKAWLHRAAVDLSSADPGLAAGPHPYVL